MGEINLFQNYFYLIGPCAKEQLLNSDTKVNMNNGQNFGDTCGVMVIIIGTRQGDPSSNPVSISHSANTFGKGMHPIILTPFIDK